MTKRIKLKVVPGVIISLSKQSINQFGRVGIKFPLVLELYYNCFLVIIGVHQFTLDKHKL